MCDNVPAETTARTLATQTGAPLGIQGLVTLGMTRAQVRAAMGNDTERLVPGDNGGPSPLPLRPFWCEKRLALGYADTPDMNNMLDGQLSDDDVLVRINTVEGFAGATDTGISHGSAEADVATAYGTLSGRVNINAHILGGPAAAYPGRGLVFGTNGGTVTYMAVHTPADGDMTPTPLNGTLSLSSNQLGSIRATAINGTSFGTIRQRLGSQPDVLGMTTVNNQSVGYLSYSSLGVRVVAVSSTPPDLNNLTAFQIYLTPPFAGFDGTTTLGLGASKSDFDAAFPNPTTTDVNGATLYVYTTGTGLFPPKMAVGFSQDSDCVQRAQLMVLNWVEL